MSSQPILAFVITHPRRAADADLDDPYPDWIEGWGCVAAIDAVITLPRLLNMIGGSGGGTVTLGETNRPIEMNVRYAMVRLEETDDD